MLLTIILTGAVVSFALFLAAYTIYRREKRRVLAQISRYFAAPDEKTPSQVALLVDATAQVLAKRLVLELKTTVMGMTSVDVKKDIRSEDAAAMAANPMLGVLLNMVPGLRRQLRNPLVAGALSKFLGGTGGNGSKSPPPPPAEQPQLFFPLR